jgi:uncharacterized protein YdbL (DUF1318 family)
MRSPAMSSRSVAVFLSLLALVAVPCVVRAASVEELQKRFKERYPKLLQAKTDGKIGETYKGYVEAVKEEYLKDEAVKKLINDESADRKELYELMAKEEGTTVEKVAERNAVRNFKKAKKGQFLKGRDEKWEQKKEDE